MDRLLVTGASGLLGNHVTRAATGEYEVLATYNRHAVEFGGVETIECDLTDPPFPDLEAFDPTYVINCAGLADVDECERELEKARRLNDAMAGNVAELVSVTDARLIHLSTDAVFDGENPQQSEDDEPDPINVYGETKLAGERTVRETCEDTVVVRTNFFGWNTTDATGLAEWMLQRLSEGQELPGLEDVHFTPLYAGDLADLLWDLLETDYQGLLHLGGADRLTKYRFGELIAEAFGYDSDQVVPITLDDLDLDAPRGNDLSLDSSKAESVLDREIPGVREGIERMRADGGR